LLLLCLKVWMIRVSVCAKTFNTVRVLMEATLVAHVARYMIDI